MSAACGDIPLAALDGFIVTNAVLDVGLRVCSHLMPDLRTGGTSCRAHDLANVWERAGKGLGYRMVGWLSLFAAPSSG